MIRFSALITWVTSPSANETIFKEMREPKAGNMAESKNSIAQMVE
jgi:hypothetical protein